MIRAFRPTALPIVWILDSADAASVDRGSGTGVPPEKVQIHTTLLGCGLGRRAAPDFVIEAVVLSSLGGLVGIALATVASIGLAGLMNVPYLFNPGINLLSFGFSAAIGVIFGYFPARRAAGLNPIDALRHE